MVLNADAVQVNLLNPKIPGGGILCQHVDVGVGVLKEGVLPEGSGVVSARLPLVPVQVVGELVPLPRPGDVAPVYVVVKVGRRFKIPGGPNSIEIQVVLFSLSFSTKKKLLELRLGKWPEKRRPVTE